MDWSDGYSYIDSHKGDSRYEQTVQDTRHLQEEFGYMVSLLRIYDIRQSSELSVWIILEMSWLFYRCQRQIDFVLRLIEDNSNVMNDQELLKYLRQVSLGLNKARTLAQMYEHVLVQDIEGYADTRNFKETIERMMRILSINYSQINIAFDFRIEQGVELNISPTELFYVFKNLIDNASFEAKIGTPLVMSFIFSQRGNVILIDVSDNGKGITLENLEKIRSGKSFTTKGALGNGQGLLSIQQTLKAYGGTMAIESTLGKGTKFTLMIPVGMNQAMRAEKPHSNQTTGGIDLRSKGYQISFENDREDYPINFDKSFIGRMPCDGVEFHMDTILPVRKVQEYFN